MVGDPRRARGPPAGGSDGAGLSDTDWDQVVCRIIAATGWTWDQAEALTLPRLFALYDWWRDHPPLYQMVEAFLGIKPRRPADNQTTDDFADLIAEMAAAGLG